LCARELNAAQKKLDLRTRELSEALDQQKATSEVLRVISDSSIDLVSALEAIAESAARLLDVTDADIMRLEGEGLRLIAKHGPSRQWPVGSIRPINRNWVAGRAVIDRTTVQVRDLQSAESDFPEGAAYARQLGHRTTLATPLLREGNTIGAILIRRMFVRPFTDRQIELVQNFAAQAVIAIENTRLLNELRESLRQQTGTADVLNVISRSAFDVQPVFETIIKNAAQLCQSVLSAIYRSDGELVHLVAHDQFSPESVAAVRAAYPVPITSSNVIAVAVRERRVVHIADVLVSGGYTELQRASGYRALLVVPIMRDDVAIGAVAVMQLEPRLFPETQVELLKTFASQAVIAINNVRLFNELRQRTEDLSESLQQQTATADVLKVISRSTFDLQTVLDTLVESAARLCEADMAVLARPKDGYYHFEATFGFSPEYKEFVATHPAAIDRGTGTGRTLVEGTITHIPDVLTDTEYTYTEGQKIGGYRTLLAVPMLREGMPIGVLSLQRKTVRPFTEKQIELVTTFADQAVIAIENVRLFDEVQARTEELSESLQQQTATADVLKVISRSTSICRPFSIRSSSQRRGCAMPTKHSFFGAKGRVIGWQQILGFPATSKSTWSGFQSNLGDRRSWDERYWKAALFTFPTSSRTRNTPGSRRQGEVAFAPVWACRCCERAFPLAYSKCRVPPCGRSPTNRSSCSPPSPTKPSSPSRTCGCSTKSRTRASS
jgi:GAF domain-containing protein